MAVLPGFTRGLSFAGPYAFVGLSRIRESATFGDLPIAPQRDQLKCGVAVVELASGKLVSLFEFKEGIHEIFAVEVLSGTACPAISGPFCRQGQYAANLYHARPLGPETPAKRSGLTGCAMSERCRIPP